MTVGATTQRIPSASTAGASDASAESMISVPATSRYRRATPTTDGSVPPGNPFVGRAGAQAAIWSYGHRNPQGAAVRPGSGELWTSEHGPQGGDEVNRTQAGLNYGWPVISHGQEYGTTTPVGIGTSNPGMEQPASVWETRDGTPWVAGQKSSTAPAGMAFFTGRPGHPWNDCLFLGALADRNLIRLQLEGNRVVAEERLLADLGKRIRDVRVGADGNVYVLTDEDAGQLLRLVPPTAAR